MSERPQETSKVHDKIIISMVKKNPTTTFRHVKTLSRK